MSKRDPRIWVGHARGHKEEGLKSSSEKAQSLTFGPFTLDPADGVLRRGGEEIALAPKPRALLLVLAEAPGRIVPHEELMRRGWPEGPTSAGNLHQTMSVLRKALAVGPDGREYVENLQKRGYRLIAAAVPASRRLPRAAVWAAAGTLSISVAAAAALLTSGRAGAPLRVAVRAFASEGPDGDAGRRLASDLAMRLAELPDVIVVETDAAVPARIAGALEAGRALGAELVVDGTLRGRSGLDAFVSVLDVRDGTRRWSEVRAVGTSSLTRALAETTVGLLAVKTSGASRRRLLGAGSENDGALEAFLEARVLARDPSRLSDARDALRRAVSLDAKDARAHAALAEAELALAAGEGVGAAEAVSRAREEARRAAALDGGLADAQLALGAVLETRDWDFAAAERAYRRAIDARPLDADAHLREGRLLMETGRFGEAVRELRRARELDPASARTRATLAMALFLDGSRMEAWEESRVARAADPRSPWPHFYAGLLAAATDRRDEARAAFEEAWRRSGEPRFAAARAWSLARAGRAAEARGILDAVEASAPAYERAVAEEALGERSRAIALLARAAAERAPELAALGCDPRAFPFRGDPRFEELLRHAGLESLFTAPPAP